MMQNIVTILIVVSGTMLTRFLPFIVFPSGKTPPPFIQFLGRFLPNAVIGLLLIYSLKDSITGNHSFVPETLALLCIFILHKWKKNTLLSISAGTILYMVLIQNFFTF